MKDIIQIILIILMLVLTNYVFFIAIDKQAEIYFEQEPHIYTERGIK